MRRFANLLSLFACTLTLSAFSCSQQVTLSGTGVAPPTLNPSVSALTFGPELVGSTSAAQSIQLTVNGSGGAGPVNNIVPSITGPFAQVNSCGSSLTLGASCTIQVTFTPTATGVAPGVLTINGSAGQQTVTLSGTGASFGIAPLSLTFGNVLVGTTASPETVTLSNPLSAPVTFTTSITPSDYVITSGCGTSVPASGTCVLSVTFTPSVVGARPGTLTITPSVGGATATPIVIGVGVDPTGPVLSITPLALTWAQPPNNSWALDPQTLTLTNAGAAPLTISSISPPGPGYFTTSTCAPITPSAVPLTLAPGASCGVQITFSNTGAVPYNATLSIVDNAPGSPHVIPLAVQITSGGNP